MAKVKKVSKKSLGLGRVRYVASKPMRDRRKRRQKEKDNKLKRGIIDD
jgi:hypothetical protein